MLPGILCNAYTLIEQSYFVHIYRYWADVPSLYIQLYYIGLCLLPLDWFLGVVSPPEALIFWALERLLVILLGGSAMATDFRQDRIVRIVYLNRMYHFILCRFTMYCVST